MKKQMLNLGKALQRAEQKEIFGGYGSGYGGGYGGGQPVDDDCCHTRPGGATQCGLSELTARRLAALYGGAYYCYL